jgi:hypothetical protein
MLENTSIDRIMIFRAWNGELSPKWTTALFQFRIGDQKPVSYVHFELDRDYVDRIRHIVERGSMLINVSDLPKSAIREVYEAEGVKHSAWFHVSTSTLEGTKAKSITYCSFATHSEEAFSPLELARARIFVGRLKGLSQPVSAP